MTDHQEKTWQEEMVELFERIPDERKQRVHDFVVGYLLAMQPEQEAAHG